ncbi:MAG: molecular chaperone TorD family protein, partial [Pseudomonadota bacterium]
LLARLLTAAPSKAVLSDTANLAGDEATIFGAVINDLATAARTADPDAVDTEFHDLFIGVGRGELIPYASYYLTGFLHERPLAKLRGDMAAFGLKRADDINEPEDNVASILEIMAGLIDGGLGINSNHDRERAFFEAHVASWIPHFFADLSSAQNARLYANVGRAGAAFLAIEEDAFRMA